MYKIDSVSNNEPNMKKLMQNERGFIPMMIAIVVVIVVIIYLCYHVVQNAQH